MPLKPGDTVVVQEVWRDQVWAARPMRVVQDHGDFVALWFPRGTRWKAPTSNPARPWRLDRGSRLAECAALGEWIFRDAEWDVDTLCLLREGDWHAVWVSWLADGSHWGWYVNLQQPFTRTTLGFETMDLVLDIVVDPDLTWRWKDEDELQTFVERGVIDPPLAEHVRDEGLRVISRAERNEPPFCEPWPEWKPDSSWSTPALPEGWDRPCR
jgi:Protein of unknown function (DUF402)